MPSEKTPNSSAGATNQYLNIGEFPVIVALQGPLEGNKWDINAELLIGREQSCDIPIIDRQVSRAHAKITPLANGSIQLEDLSSKNGTFHQGKMLNQAVTLQDGDVIQIALIQKFAFYLSDATLPLEDLLPRVEKKQKKIRLDIKSRRVWVNDVELLPPLSVPQFKLLHALAQQSGKVVSRNELIKIVWQGEDQDGISEQAFDALTRRLRTRLAEIDPETQFLVTIRGHGLRLDQ
jgi:pSer/pThr/pTyr-binding forkhead associated (FHA) protein